MTCLCVTLLLGHPDTNQRTNGSDYSQGEKVYIILSHEYKCNNNTGKCHCIHFCTKLRMTALALRVKSHNSRCDMPSSKQHKTVLATTHF
jgi:hypothetical protein